MPALSEDVQPHPPSATRPAEPRGRRPWRRFAEARGWLGGFGGTTVTARLSASDGTRLVGSLLPGPMQHGAAIVLAHGFGASRRKPAYARLAEGLATTAPVLSLDLRGHGGSGGASTLGDLERADVAAAARWLAGLGLGRVVLVGASMGATAVLHAAARELGDRGQLGDSGDVEVAASRPMEVAGLVLISAPAWFRDPAPAGPLRRLERVWHDPLRRTALGVGLGIRLAPPSAWTGPPAPSELLGRIAAPILVVHGEDDAYFPLDDAFTLHAAARGPAQLWVEPVGFGHAEDGLSAAMVARLTGAVDQVLSEGVFPPR
ncbi:MAG: alpha/beta hydrolase [Nitriliruptoraceae bacterium]